LFNANQQAALDSTRNTAVVAGPGSGKTRVIVAKILKTYRENPSNRVCAVTFTRDAADELAHRVRSAYIEEVTPKFGAQGAATKAEKFLQVVRIGTFHSLAIHQLRDARMLGQLATPQAQSGFIHQAARAASTQKETVTYEKAVEIIEAAKCSLHQNPELMADPVVATYQKLLARNRMSDLYDVIREAVLGMRDGAVKPMGVGSVPCTHLLVDEFQDSDEVQYAWIMDHVQRQVVTMVVGDDDQTIYEWRRALGYKGIEAFKRDANADEVVLGDNYRCRTEILGHADTLIRNNKESRIEKRLYAAKGPGGIVEVFHRATIEEQAQALYEKLEPYRIPCNDDVRFDYTFAPGSACVIGRNHGTLHAVEAFFLNQKVKFQRTGSSFWNQHFLMIFLSILKSLQTGETSGIDMALSYFGASNDGIDLLHKACAGKFSQFLDARLPPVAGASREDLATFDDFSANTRNWRDLIREGDYDLAINGVVSYMNDNALYRESDETKREILAQGAAIIKTYGAWSVRSSTGERTPSLSERVDIALKPRKKESDGVALHTMHSCKGLEFDTVGVVHVSEGVIPNPERPDEINDRRLVYVAMTRAKERLFMTYKSGSISRFITETGILKK
jgi:DNA helicase-2/ATP-dependent DNA helicase PcrA